jgi:ferric-dicitrate binding protein FerR (iron transport regulator)
VKLANGEIVYKSQTETIKEVSYNTLIVPRGSKVVSLTLADGSKIWMNAESSLTYPTAFIGKERSVELKGEAFFEIASNKNMPFIVRKDDVGVQVFGTSFNVNAYEDEKTIDVTLLEGSVQVKKGTATTLLQPGQQAQVNRAGSISLVEHADTEAAVAWKNGYFQFTGNDIKTVMRQIARWYNVDVEYHGTIPERKFAGQMDRSSNLSHVLKILEESNVHFKTEGKKVIVMP